MYDLKALPLWAQKRIGDLERQLDKLNTKYEAIRYHDPIEDIICGSPYNHVYDLESEKAHE